MTTIAAIEISTHRIHLDPAFDASWDPDPRTFFDATIVRVHDSAGQVGIGSGDPMHGFAAYAHAFLGTDPRDVVRHHRVLTDIDFHAGRPWPFEAALWDLVGVIQNRPLHELLGGATDRVRPYLATGSIGTFDDLAAIADYAIAHRFPALKIRFGRSAVSDDLEILARLVDHTAGSDLELMIDCNQGWRMPADGSPPWSFDTAAEVAAAAAAAGAIWIEEPLHHADHRGMRALRDLDLVRIAGGEMTRDPGAFDRMLELGSLDVYQPDAVLTVGLLGLVDLADRVLAANAWFTPHTWGNGIGLAVNMALTAGVGGGPYLEYPFDPPAWTPAARDFMLTQPIEPDADGWLVCPEGPGLGLELDRPRLADSLIDRTVLR